MMLHLTINCKDLDELKSAKATIDRLVTEQESIKQNQERKCPGCNGTGWTLGGRLDNDTQTVPCELCNPVSKDQEWDCPKCGPVTFLNNVGMRVLRCGLCGSDLVKRGQVKVNTRTRSQVLAQRARPHGACCNKYADMAGCDCLETAQPDVPVKRRNTFIPCGICGRHPDRCDCGMYRG